MAGTVRRFARTVGKLALTNQRACEIDIFKAIGIRRRDSIRRRIGDFAGPELTNYVSQCHGAGLKLQQTRGSRWLYGAPGHSMYNHMRAPNDRDVDCRGGIPHRQQDK